MLPGTIVTIPRLWSWRCSATSGIGNSRSGGHPATHAYTIRSLRSRRRSPTKVIRSLRTRRRTSASEHCARAWRATPSELRHRERLADLRAAALECLGHGPVVRIVESCVGVIVIWLVWVEVWEWRDGVWVWVKLRGGVCRGGCSVADRVATNIGSIDA